MSGDLYKECSEIVIKNVAVKMPPKKVLVINNVELEILPKNVALEIPQKTVLVIKNVALVPPKNFIQRSSKIMWR